MQQQDGTGVLQSDPWYVLVESTTDNRLEPFSGALRHRYSEYKKAHDLIVKNEGSVAKFAEGYKTMGFQVDGDNGVRYREWAPNATAARLIGDFSESHCS
jgi:1,4-alpha-glucan branching enzyme